jgi:diguanylate cyclase (GGDEF)-like protein
MFGAGRPMRTPEIRTETQFPISIEREELRGITRTIAEIHWLLVILVLLYATFGRPTRDEELAVTTSLFFYAAFVMSFRYANFYRAETRWKLAVETSGMIAFITWVAWFTGGIESPLLNTFLLPVIAAALTLGKLATVVQLALIVACYVFLGGGISVQQASSLQFYGGLLAHLAPVLLVAYVTTMFSADIRYGLNHAKLLAETDELTGLLNKRGFAITADRLFAQAQRYRRACSIMMIDADNLKLVNDTSGHAAGDDLLKSLARCIQLELRHTDMAARLGGDEFIVMLPETPPKGAHDVAERIRTAVAATQVGTGAQQTAASVSIGVASYPGDGATLDIITAHADRAMYDAKRRGGNGVAQARTPEASGS